MFWIPEPMTRDSRLAYSKQSCSISVTELGTVKVLGTNPEKA